MHHVWNIPNMYHDSCKCRWNIPHTEHTGTVLCKWFPHVKLEMIQRDVFSDSRATGEIIVGEGKKWLVEDPQDVDPSNSIKKLSHCWRECFSKAETSLDG